MFALKRLRARRQPANQAHVTNLKENPALLAADAAEAALRGFAEIETTVGVARYAPAQRARHPRRRADRPARRDDAVRGRGAAQPAARDPRHGLLRRDPQRLRHRGGVRRRRRHALVEGLPGVGLRVARGQGALHVRRRLRGADGRVRGPLDPLPRGALPGGHPRGRLAGRAERRHLVRGARAQRARRDARDPGREPAGGVARPGGRVRQRRDRLALPHAPHRQADGPVPAGHRLRHERLQRHAAPRQHVRRRQLRRRRHRRVADAAARLAGRRRHRARARGAGAGGARARGPRDPGGLRPLRAARR